MILRIILKAVLPKIPFRIMHFREQQCIQPQSWHPTAVLQLDMLLELEQVKGSLKQAPQNTQERPEKKTFNINKNLSVDLVNTKANLDYKVGGKLACS